MSYDGCLRLNKKIVIKYNSLIELSLFRGGGGGVGFVLEFAIYLHKKKQPVFLSLSYKIQTKRKVCTRNKYQRNIACVPAPATHIHCCYENEPGNAHLILLFNKSMRRTIVSSTSDVCWCWWRRTWFCVCVWNIFSRRPFGFGYLLSGHRWTKSLISFSTFCANASSSAVKKRSPNLLSSLVADVVDTVEWMAQKYLSIAKYKK